MFWIAIMLLSIGLAFVLFVLISSEEPVLEGDALPSDNNAKVPHFIVDYLASNGVELPPIVIYASLSVAGAAALLSLLALPLQYGGVAAFACAGLLILAVKFVGNRRRTKMLEQLPSFVNQVTRRLSAGISVENAFADSVETLERPLGTVMRRVVRRVHMGYDLHQAFDREAKHTKLHEFNVLATAIRINEQYGGSIRSILDDIVDILRLDEAGKRELSAMTGETRVTAFVLAMLPPGIAAYMFGVKPEFLLGMWADPSGQRMLIGAVVLQVIGVIVLMRMISSIGK